MSECLNYIIYPCKHMTDGKNSLFLEFICPRCKNEIKVAIREDYNGLLNKKY